MHACMHQHTPSPHRPCCLHPPLTLYNPSSCKHADATTFSPSGAASVRVAGRWGSGGRGSSSGGSGGGGANSRPSSGSSASERVSTAAAAAAASAAAASGAPCGGGGSLAAATAAAAASALRAQASFNHERRQHWERPVLDDINSRRAGQGLPPVEKLTVQVRFNCVQVCVCVCVLFLGLRSHVAFTGCLRLLCMSGRGRRCICVWLWLCVCLLGQQHNCSQPPAPFSLIPLVPLDVLRSLSGAHSSSRTAWQARNWMAVYGQLGPRQRTTSSPTTGGCCSCGRR